MEDKTFNRRDGAGWYLKAVGLGLLLIVTVMFFSSLIWGFGVVTAGIFGKGEAHKQIQSAPSRINAYTHFFDLCSSIQRNESQLDGQFDSLATATDSDDKQRIQQNINSLKAVRLGAIYRYNTDAAKDYTIGQFRDSNLPYYIPPTEYNEKGQHTSCVS